MHDPIRSKAGLALLARLRTICAKLPETVEKVDEFGHTTFRVADKPFIFAGENGEGLSISVKADPHMQEILLQESRYYKTPYIGRFGWVSQRVDAELNWSELEPLIRGSYLRAAPKRLSRKIPPS